MSVQGVHAERYLPLKVEHQAVVVFLMWCGFEFLTFLTCTFTFISVKTQMSWDLKVVRSKKTASKTVDATLTDLFQLYTRDKPKLFMLLTQGSSFFSCFLKAINRNPERQTKVNLDSLKSRYNSNQMWWMWCYTRTGFCLQDIDFFLPVRKNL